MGLPAGIAVDREALAAFCRRHRIRELSLFGSVLREDFRPDSDVDVLVEFESGRTPSLFGLADLEEGLRRMLGRRVDLVTRPGLSPYLKESIEASRDVQYVREGPPPFAEHPATPPAPAAPYRGKDDAVYLHHMLDAAAAALAYAAGLDQERFLADREKQDAVIRRIEIVGEASRRLSDGFGAAHPEIPWSQAVGMRNRLVHGYFDVDLDAVWDVVRHDLPELIRRLEPLVR